LSGGESLARNVSAAKIKWRSLSVKLECVSGRGSRRGSKSHSPPEPLIPDENSDRAGDDSEAPTLTQERYGSGQFRFKEGAQRSAVTQVSRANRPFDFVGREGRIPPGSTVSPR